MVKLSQTVMKIGLLLLALGVGVSHAASELITSIDKNPVLIGDSLIITVTIDDDVANDNFNPDQWLGDSFEVLNVRTNRRTSMVNNQFNRTTNFLVSVRAPQQPGDYRIPALSLAGVSSDPIEVKVLPLSEAEQTQQNRDAFIKVSLSDDSVYVQQQVTLVARLYLATNLQSGNIIAPQLADADIVQLGKDEESYEIIDGKRFQIFQRSYLITPQRSGQVMIRGPVFSGQISGDDSTAIFSSFATEAVTTATQDIPLEVKPIPANWQGDWVPAELVTLSAEIVSENAAVPSQIEQGQPLTLRYRLTGLGIKPEQLPTVRLPDLDGVSIYPEQPQSSSMLRNGQVIAQKTVDITIIPRQTGPLSIPEVRLPWFNTAIDKGSVTASESFSFTVTPATSLQPELPAQPEQQQPATSTATDMIPSTPQAGTDTPETTTPQRLWFILTLAFASLWLLTLGWTLFLRRKRTEQIAVAGASTTQASIPPASAGKAWQQLQQAASANQARETLAAMRTWTERQFQTGHLNLSGLREFFADSPVATQLDYLLACQYGTKPNAWQEGRALLRALKAFRQQQPEPKASDIPELYPRNNN